MTMAEWITLDTHHGAVRAWQALPEGTARGGLVVVQEIFGANPHIRGVAERFAAEGYAVLAPSFLTWSMAPMPTRMPCPTTPTA